jgi:hypothetical protein
MRFYQKAAIMAATCFLFVQGVFAAIPADYKGVVFDSLKGVPQQIPGWVYAPYFDKGDTGVTFRYTWSNMGDCFFRNGDPGKKVSLQFFGDYKDMVAGNVHLVDSACYWTPKQAHLGWVQNGEWLKYTVHVNTAGTYKMILHHSVVDTSNLIVFDIGDLPPDSVGGLPISIRPPGDHEINHDWKWDTTKTRLALDTGLYVIKVSFSHEGLNFHGMKFVLDGTSAVTGAQQGLVQKGFEILPVVNGNNLTVSYSLRQAGPVTVSVFDCAGRAMVPAAVRNLNAGDQKQTINLGAMGRGVYFVRVEQNGIRSVVPFNIR